MLRLSLLLLLLSSSFVVAETKLSIGIASQDVSPELKADKPVFLAGFGPNRKATSVLDPIMARAIVLDDGKQKMAWVIVDVVGLFHEFSLAVRSRLSGFAHVIVTSTHNHEGPDTMGLWGPNPIISGVDPAYMKRLEQECVAVIQKADQNRKVVTATIGKVNIPEWLTDNRLPMVKHDELVSLLFQDPQTKQNVGVLVQWNCHPESLDSKNTQMSADYVAYTVRKLEATLKCPAIYFTGTVGGLMTTFDLEIKDATGRAMQDGEVAKTIRYGQIIAEKALQSLKTGEAIELTPFQIRNQKILLPMQNKLYQAGWALGVLNRRGYRWEGNPQEQNPKEIKEISGEIAVQTELGFLKLGELEVACIPGEIYPELVLGKVQDPVDPGADFPNAPIEPSIYSAFKSKHRMLIGLANDEIGYIIPKRQWDNEKPFCYGRKKSQYGEINSIGPEAGPIICEAFQKLVSP